MAARPGRSTAGFPYLSIFFSTPAMQFRTRQGFQEEIVRCTYRRRKPLKSVCEMGQSTRTLTTAEPTEKWRSS